MTENVLFFGDNLPVLREYVPDEYVDLIYLDPPFNSKATYNILFGGNGKSEAQIRAFDDTWHWGAESERAYADVMEHGGRPADVLEAFRRFLGDNDMMAYLAMMTPRLIELRRVLKPTGSLYLHCDPTASHYLKIVMDAIFDVRNFRNEIIWCYNVGGKSKKLWGKKHDILLFYTKTDHYFFDGTAAGIARDTGSKSFGGKIGIDENGRRYQDKLVRVTGKYYRYYLDEPKIPEDWWTDINSIQSQSKERLSYPTQKPLALLERIIKASSTDGDVVLDPFCGCGTAVHAAEKLKRQWVGIDITHLAIGLIEYRLRDAFGIRPKVIGAPEDLAGAHDLFERDPFQLEAWAVTRLLGIKPNERQTGDRGIDGVGRFYLGRNGKGRERYGKLLVSVKGGQRLSVAMIRDFRGTMEREGTDLGVFICLHTPTRDMIREAASAGRYRELEGYDFPRIQIFTIADHFAGHRPDLPPTIEEARRRAREEVGEQPDLI